MSVADTRGELIRLVLHATPDAVRAGLACVDRAVTADGISSDHACLVMLVLAEALNNIVEHAYRDRDDGRIALCVSRHAELLDLSITDSGQGFPGGAPPLPREIALDVARPDLPEGGFGWNLIHGLSRTVAYRREADKNHLKITLDLSSLGEAE